MMDAERIYSAARKLKKKYATADPFELCECVGLNVRFADIGSLKGMYKYIKGNYFVLINDSLDARSKALVCCHELCHHLLHKDIAKNIGLYDTMLYDMDGRTENEANMFAAEIMIEDSDITNYACEGRTAADIAAILGTDINLVLIKAELMRKRGFDINCALRAQSDFLAAND